MGPERCGRCLVVDEDPLVRWSVVRFLETRCQEARSVASGELALALLREWPVDLVVADTSQSGMEESPLVRCCQRLQPRPRIVLLSASAGQRRGTDLESLGILGVIEKPFILDRLGSILFSATGQAGETTA
jgi:CheY-like chemotaxis protein